ncbi:NfeD family protein [soil metagenome]
MNPGDFGVSAALVWLVAAVVLGVAELIIPGVFVVFLAVAAAAVGVTLLAAPGLPVAVQLIGFALWSTISVLIGRRWYREYPVDSADPLLNDRAARLIGEIVTVAVPIEGGNGRVRVGDGEWMARGSDAAAGSRVRVVACTAGTLIVEPVD